MFIVLLTEEAILFGKPKGPSSRKMNPSTLTRHFFALPALLLLAGTTTLDT
jgi:hypothetical protein